MLYHARDMVWYVRQKITIEQIYPLTDCCHIYTHDDLLAYLFYVLKHCFRCCYDMSYKQGFQINSCCFHTVKPKLVTQPAIVHGLFVAPSF